MGETEHYKQVKAQLGRTRFKVVIEAPLVDLVTGDVRGYGRGREVPGTFPTLEEARGAAVPTPEELARTLAPLRVRVIAGYWVREKTARGVDAVWRSEGGHVASGLVTQAGTRWNPSLPPARSVVPPWLRARRRPN